MDCGSAEFVLIGLLRAMGALLSTAAISQRNEGRGLSPGFHREAGYAGFPVPRESWILS